MESKPAPINDANTEACDVCGIMVKRKSDMRRHKLIHDRAYAIAPSYPCPYEGCTYSALQKSNLATHKRTHTGEKPHACPDCTFRTADPGSLTRHRKAQHGYKPRHHNPTGKVVKQKNDRRTSPYERKVSVSSPDPTNRSLSSCPTGTPPPFGNPANLDDSCYLDPALFNACLNLSSDSSQSYTWDKDLDLSSHIGQVFASSGTGTSSSVIPGPMLAQVGPKQTYPANGVAHLEGWELSNFDGSLRGISEHWMYDSELLPPMFPYLRPFSTVQAPTNIHSYDSGCAALEPSALLQDSGACDPLAQVLCQMSQPLASPRGTGQPWWLGLLNYIPPCTNSTVEVADLAALPEPASPSPSPTSSLFDLPDVFSEDQIIQTSQLGLFDNPLGLI